MPTAAEHYANHLAAVYVWMTGGFEATLDAGGREVELIAPQLPSNRKTIVDLGTGFGMHAIPFARKGFSVIAIDSSAELLATLERHRGEFKIKSIEDDLLLFRRHLSEPPAAILCMGDTLTHLSDLEKVDALIREAALALETKGLLVLTFRDYSTPLLAEQRFIPVRSDDQRIFICFLEYESDVVKVHDIVQEREKDGWKMRVSWYKKLRLDPTAVAASLQSNGFEVSREVGARGMIRLIAKRI